MTGSIICGVDDSPSAKGAARVARELSAQLDCRLVFVHVVDDRLPQGEINAVAARLHDLAESACEVDCGAHWLVEVGHPADRLVAVAEKAAARLLVVGSTGPRSSLLGSISAEVSRRAPCPVVVVAPGSDLPLTHTNVRSHRDAGGGLETAGAPHPSNGDGAAHATVGLDVTGGIVRFNVR